MTDSIGQYSRETFQPVYNQSFAKHAEDATFSRSGASSLLKVIQKCCDFFSQLTGMFPETQHLSPEIAKPIPMLSTGRKMMGVFNIIGDSRDLILDLPVDSDNEKATFALNGPGLFRVASDLTKIPSILQDMKLVNLRQANLVLGGVGLVLDGGETICDVYESGKKLAVNKKKLDQHKHETDVALGQLNSGHAFLDVNNQTNMNKSLQNEFVDKRHMTEAGLGLAKAPFDLATIALDAVAYFYTSQVLGVVNAFLALVGATLGVTKTWVKTEEAPKYEPKRIQELQM